MAARGPIPPSPRRASGGALRRPRQSGRRAPGHAETADCRLRGGSGTLRGARGTARVPGCPSGLTAGTASAPGACRRPSRTVARPLLGDARAPPRPHGRPDRQSNPRLAVLSPRAGGARHPFRLAQPVDWIVPSGRACGLPRVSWRIRGGCMRFPGSLSPAFPPLVPRRPFRTPQSSAFVRDRPSIRPAPLSRRLVPLCPAVLPALGLREGSVGRSWHVVCRHGCSDWCPSRLSAWGGFPLPAALSPGRALRVTGRDFPRLCFRLA
jgi:hypothetical protein